MVKTSGTGAQNGRAGGRLSGGVRAAKALAVAPRVRVVAEGSRPSKRARRDEPMATPTPVTLGELTAAKGHAQAMAESLGLSPNSTKIMVASALGTFAGSAMAAKAPAAAAVTSTRVGKQPVRAEPQAMAGASSSASEPLSLKGRPRGSQVVVQVAAEYGARKVYTFSDVCALATRIMAGTVMVADLRQKNTDGAWTYGIPRSTMTEKWLKDDHSVMQSQNPPRLGVEGSPHWLVERDVRGRTELSKPGPGTVMGGGETQLMHTLATAAKKGWAYMEVCSHPILSSFTVRRSVSCTVSWFGCMRF